MVYNNQRVTRDLHWHIGTTCCGGVGDDCEHEKQYEKDMVGREGKPLPELCSTQYRLANGLMELEPYSCGGDA